MTVNKNDPNIIFSPILLLYPDYPCHLSLNESERKGYPNVDESSGTFYNQF